MREFKDYFQQEMNQIKELAVEFARAHPALAPMLKGPVSDPDVERLVEAVSFQMAMMRQKLDDDFPEIIQDLIRIIWPHYLRPVPAATTVAFTPSKALADSTVIPAGSLLSSARVDGTACMFSTCFDVEVHPLKIIDASFEQPAGKAPQVKMVMDLGAVKLSNWDVKSLRFFLSGDYAGASDLYLLLMKNLRGIKINPLDGGKDITLPGSCLQSAAFADNTALIPYPPHAFPGYRNIQEYFFMPEKFLYVDLSGWEKWRTRGTGSRFELCFEFDSLPVRPPKIDKDYFVLYATPAINIFEYTARPITLDHKTPWYLLQPDSANPDNYQVFSVENVRGRSPGDSGERIYKPFEQFRQETDAAPVYHAINRQSLNRHAADVYFSVSYKQGGIPEDETISVALKCTNGHLPERLRVGDICINRGMVPQSVSFRNIKPITPPIALPMGSNFLWRLISLMSLNYLSLKNIENFQSLLEFYIFPDTGAPLAVAANRKRISALESMEDTPSDIIFKGSIMRGREITIRIRRDHFISLGDMHIFGSVLDSFLGGYASINSFTQLVFKETLTGETYEWPAKLGRHFLI